MTEAKVVAPSVDTRCAVAEVRVRLAEILLRRYLDAHCQASDQEGRSVRCECALCQDTRTYLRTASAE